jgi:Ca-activated chloride channel homolog
MIYRFQHIEILTGLALIIIPVAFFLLLLQWKKKTKQNIGNPILVNRLLRNYSPLKVFSKFFLLVLSLAIIIMAAANLQKKGAADKINRSGVDIMIALDVSKSMLAQDVKPSRLERAKQTINKIISNSPNDRIGLVLFAGRAYIQMPLTIDHAAAGMYVQTAAPDVVPTQGTVVAEALKVCNSAFNVKEKKYKTIVLISDGEDHDEATPETAKALAENGVMVNAIGIGSIEGSSIIDPATNDFKKDAQGNNVISKLNETVLRQIAQTTGGIYTVLNDPADAASAIRKQIEGVEKKVVEDNSFINYESLFQWFIGMALLLLMLELFIPETKKTATA